MNVAQAIASVLNAVIPLISRHPVSAAASSGGRRLCSHGYSFELTLHWYERLKRHTLPLARLHNRWEFRALSRRSRADAIAGRRVRMSATVLEGVSNLSAFRTAVNGASGSAEVGATRPPPLLRAVDLSKKFGGVAAVDRMHLDVEKGGITGLIGPNGAGKSTLFNLVAGVIAPDAGRVSIRGEDLTGAAPHEMCRRGLTRTFQLSRELGRMTVLENLMLAAPAQTGESLFGVFGRRAAFRRDEARTYRRAREVLETVRLSQVANEYAANVSGGQKKLLELGRALMTDCELILLDEPGAGVNPTLMAELTNLISALNRDHGKTLLVIEHDMRLIEAICDPVIVMSEGRQLAAGRFADLRRDSRVTAAYLGRAA